MTPEEDIQLEITKRIESWFYGNRMGPVKLQFNPTNRCNLKCIFCWLRDSSRVDYSNELTDQRYCELVEEANSLGVRYIQITGGGEPFMRKTLILNLMERIKRHSIYGSIITNGTLIEKEDAQRIVEYGWDEIVFSIDSPEATVHDEMRAQSGCLDKIVKTIKTINQIKVHINNKPKLCIHTVLCNRNYHQIPRLIKFAHSLGCTNVFIEPLVVVAFHDDSGEKLKLSPVERRKLHSYVKEGIEIANRFGIEHSMQNFLDEDLVKETNRMDRVIQKERDNRISTPCFEPWYNVVIRPSGLTGPCCMFDYSGEFVHNQSLSDIWFGPYFEKVRATLLDGKLPQFCSQCQSGQVIENRRIREVLIKRMR